MNKHNNSDLLIGFDLGTSAMKAILSDQDGNILAQSSRQVKLLCFNEAAVELDCEDYFNDVCSMLRELISAVDKPNMIKGLCFSGASGNTVLLDKNLKPISKVISWMDMRAADKGTMLWSELDSDRIYEVVGWPFRGTFPLAHLVWLKIFRPELWQNTRYFAMLNSYIYYRLCGRLIIDYSKATTFYLQDQKERKWNNEILDFLDIQENSLPELTSSGTACGNINVETLKAPGLMLNTVLVTGTFDHPSAAISTGVLEEGEVLISAGTSWVVFTPIDKREIGLSNGMLVDPFLSPSGCWGGMLSLTAIGERMNEYLENSSAFKNGEICFDTFNRLALEANPGAGGFYINLFQQPYQLMAEQLEDIQQENIARALMEGIVFLIRNKLDMLQRMIKKPIKRIVLTGGPTKSFLWVSILADVLNSPITVPETGQNAGAMGAVIFAGIGTGVFTNEFDGYLRTKSNEVIIEPNPITSKKYQKIYKEYENYFNLDCSKN